jgi:hypothetical protein
MTRPIPVRTWLGSLIIVVSQGATLARIEPFYSWHTPIAWTGYILAVDGLVWKRRGSSWLSDARAEMLFLAFVSVPLPGYLGFPPFAVECFVMYIWVRAFIWRAAARPVSI